MEEGETREKGTTSRLPVLVLVVAVVVVVVALLLLLLLLVKGVARRVVAAIRVPRQ